jgi:hypothetical protein
MSAFVFLQDALWQMAAGVDFGTCWRLWQSISKPEHWAPNIGSATSVW